MALFRRNKDEDVLPDEVRDYYKDEQRNRMGMAWLLAIGGFILTVAVVLALFFAGRWAYQAVFVDDDADTTEVTSPEDGEFEDDETPFVDRNDEDNNGNGDDANGNGDANDSNGTRENNGQSDGSEDDPDGVPSVGPGDEELPRTGPARE